MESRPTNRKLSRSGFTMIELLVSTAVGTVLLASLMSFHLFSLASFASMSNYSELNNQSRNASDMISQDIRSSTSVASASTTQLVLSGLDGTNTTYVYDTGAGTLTRTRGSDGRTFLKGVNSLTFSLYQRPATNGAYNTFPTATAATAKLVALQWTCSRTLTGSRLNTESIYTGLINLRNQ